MTDGETIMTVAGEVDAYTAEDLRARLAEVISCRVAHMTVDLSETTFIDSTGIGVLVTALKRIAASGGTMVLQGVPAPGAPRAPHHRARPGVHHPRLTHSDAARSSSSSTTAG